MGIAAAVIKCADAVPLIRIAAARTKPDEALLGLKGFRKDIVQLARAVSVGEVRSFRAGLDASDRVQPSEGTAPASAFWLR